jgi:hypothetical protein
MKALLVGDLHVTVDELEDSERALELVESTALRLRPDYVVFLGDQHHNHNIVRIEVLDFWSRHLEVLGAAGQRSIMLVGNHDRSHDTGLKIHALRYETATNHVVSTPETIGGVRFLPWMPTNEGFLAAAEDHKILFCHQTFDGSKFENGSWAPGGIDPKALKAEAVVSGHIHCFDSETEILTQRGWMCRAGLREDDKVVGMNVSTDRLEWQPINEIIDSAPQPVVSVKSKQVDLVVSHGHELLARAGGSSAELGGWEKIRADARDGRFLSIPISGVMERQALPYSDDEIRLMVWIAADGHISPEHYVRWHLRKARKIERLSALLTRMGADFSINAQSSGTSKINLLDGEVRNRTKDWFDPSDKHLPALLLGADARQARVILEEYEATDGHRNGGQVQIGTSRKIEADILQTIFATNGIACTATPKKGMPKHTHLKCLADKEFSMIYLPRNRTFLEGEAETWCVRTRLTTVMVRRNGHVSVTGNCPQSFGAVWYPGAPRWRTVSDANVERAIWLVDAYEGTVATKDEWKVPTAGHCRALYHFDDFEGVDSAEPKVIQPARVSVNIHGTPEYIKTKVPVWTDKKYEIATFPTTAKASAVRESEGVNLAMQKYLVGFKSPWGTPSDVISRLVAERIRL